MTRRRQGVVKVAGVSPNPHSKGQLTTSTKLPYRCVSAFSLLISFLRFQLSLLCLGCVSPATFFVSPAGHDSTSFKMWLPTSISALWLAGCVIAAGSEKGSVTSTDENSIRRIPVRINRVIWRIFAKME